MSENKNTGAEVSSTPYLAPEKRIKMTEEPQAKTSLAGHAVPSPGHLRVLSQEGVGEREGAKKSDWGKHQPDWEETPPDAPPAKVVAGGGTVGPDADVDPASSEVQTGAPTKAKSAPKKRTTRKSTTKKSAGSGAGTTSKEK